MKKIIVLCVCIFILFCTCSKKSIVTSDNKIEKPKKEDIIRIEPESKVIHVSPWKNDSTILTLKYKTSGIKGLRYGNDVYDVLLDEVLYFYENEIGEHYLGKVDRTGAYNNNDEALFLTSSVYCLKDAYVSDIILKFPLHVDYLWFDCDKDNDKDNSHKLHITFEPAINLDIDLENMTIKKLIPNI